ncbi:hypothetical protein GmHk_17G047718 [Glycine max]|nr:hypothetical protein GmHk_17G047718 [Glycine max]
MITIMMVADTVAVTAAKGLGVLRAYQSTCNFSVADQISAMIQTYDAVAPPPVKPTTYRLRRRTLLRRKTTNQTQIIRFGGGNNWDEPSSSVPDPAFDFVYQVLSWIMLSNCLHFSFKRIVRIVAAGSIVDSDREKVPARLVPIC